MGVSYQQVNTILADGLERMRTMEAEEQPVLARIGIGGTRRKIA